MARFEFPELTPTAVQLTPAPRVGGPAGPRSRAGARLRARGGKLPSVPLTRRVEFGGPVATPLRESDHRVQDDPDLLTFMRSRSAAWQLVHSAVTFPKSQDGAELDTATVELRLEGSPEILAWSMLPDVASTPIEIGGGFSIGPSLKLKMVEASAGTFNRQTTRRGAEAFIVSEELLTSRPRWRFKRTKAVKLEGAHRLVMIVQAPVGTKAQLAVSLGGSIRTGRRPGWLKRTQELETTAGPSISLAF